VTVTLRLPASWHAVGHHAWSIRHMAVKAEIEIYLQHHVKHQSSEMDELLLPDDQ
jgi:hypothetical protein